MTEFPIYILGDAESYHHMFNSIAMLMDSNFIEVATSLAMMILMLRIGIAFSKANAIGGATGVLFGIGIFAAGLYPTTTAHIIDVRQQGATTSYTKVDNLPFALVFIAYGGSSFLVSMGDLLDSAFSVVDSNKATQIGIGRQPELLASVLKASSLDTQEDDFKMTFFENAFKIYTKDCAMSTSYIPDAGIKYFTKSRGDILEQIHYDVLGIPTMAYTNSTFSDGSVVINQCRALYDYLETQRNAIEMTLYEKVKKSNPDIDWDSYNEDIAKGLYEAGFRVESITELSGTYSAGLRASMINYALGKTLEDSISDYKYDIPGVASDLVNYSVNKSMFAMTTDGMGTIAWINKIAPLVIQYSLLFSYGLFLLVIPVAIGMGYPNAMKILSNYAMGIVALHIGYLAAIIANSISIFYTSRASLDQVLTIGNNMTAVSAIPHLNQHAAEMAGVSGVLLIMAYTAGTAIIFKGETAALQGAMGTIAGRFKNDMLTAAEDMSRKQGYDEFEQQQALKSARQFIKDGNFNPAPMGVGEVEYANSLKRGLEELSSGHGFAQARMAGGSGFNGDYFSGTSNKSASMASSTATLGANTTTEQAINSGVVTGSMEAGGMIANASLMERANSLMQGTMKQTQQKLSSTATFGDNVTSEQAINSGNVMGSMEAGTTKGNASLMERANSLMSGTMKQTQQKLSSTATFGDNVTSEQAINSGNVMGLQSAGNAKGMDKALEQEGSNAIMNAARVGSLAQIKDQIQNANTLQSKFGNDLDGKARKMSYNDMAQAESEMKLAGRLGSAGGYRALGDKAFDMTAENADYGVQSKTLATQAGIQGKGGSIDSAVATDVANALLKAVSEKLNVDAQKDKGILSADGTAVSEDGMKAMAIKPNQDAKTMMAQKEMGEKAGEYLSKLEDKLRKDGMSEEKIGQMLSPYKNDDGSYKQGQDFWDAMAAQKAGVFNGHNSIMMGDGTMFSGGFAKDGGITGKLSSGISSTRDDSNNTINGSDDKGLVKRGVENALSSVFGEEIARDMISAWNGGGEFVSGAGVVGGAAFIGKKAYDKLTSNPATNIPTDSKTKAAVDTLDDSLSKYSNAQGHNSSLATEGKSSLFDNVSKHMDDLIKGGGAALKGAAVLGSVYEAAGAMSNVFTAIQETGQNFYKTGEFDGSKLATAAKQVPITIMNSALDTVNTVASAAYSVGATPFTANTMGENFNRSFETMAKDYSELSAQAAPSFFEQMQAANNHISPAASSAIDSSQVAIAERHIAETKQTQQDTQVGTNEMLDVLSEIVSETKKKSKE
ncbi:MAG: conjugal transfer protein TraG N-terminal domain-containing protein [Arcobacteraceae bacterium]